MNKSVIKRIICGLLVSIIASSSLFILAENEISKLTFEEKNGNVYFQSNYQEDVDKLLMLKEMEPGKTYQNELEIENNANKNYELFLQIILEDPSNPDAVYLLSKINIKMYYNEELLFDGTADALTKSNQSLHLNEMSKLGTLAKKQKAMIKIESTLDPNFWKKSESVTKYFSVISGTGTENDPYIYGKEQDEKPLANAYKAVSYSLADLKSYMAQTKGIFYAKSNDEVVPINPPSTNDTFSFWYIFLIVVPAILTVLFIIKKEKNS